MNRKEFLYSSLMILGACSLDKKKDFFSNLATKEPFTQEELIGKATIELSGTACKLRKEAFEAYSAMANQAQKDGFLIHCISSYRSYEHQNNIWTRKYNQFSAQQLNSKAIIAKIIDYSTIPGTSRHHWGTDLDIVNGKIKLPKDPLNTKHFEKGGIYEPFKNWLDKNAASFGFYLVYTNTPDRKGFKYEPWHYSYKEISQKMLQEFKKLDLIAILQKNKLLGSNHFTEEFINKYIKENILDINPTLL